MAPDASSAARTILTINGGSSSVKLAVFDAASLDRIHSRRIDEVGPSAAKLWDWLDSRVALDGVAAVGHRIVHGGVHLAEHQRVTPGLLKTLEDSRELDPAHLPQEIAMIQAVARRLPNVPQVACFDTEFHRDLPRVAQLLPIPRTYLDSGIRRLGFHGLSYTYLRDELRRIAPSEAEGRVILSHLGSGASLAAMRHGRPIDTTMAFTPAAGLVMSTRPGDLDPGLLIYLMRVEGMSPERMDAWINQHCGLLGVSGTSASMEELLSRRSEDTRATEAVLLFCYSAVKWIGAFAAVLGGLDTLVFSGGIGEKSSVIRREICSQLSLLNVILDDASNEVHASVISDNRSAVRVRVIPTDEEIVIARTARKILEEP